ncbi:hypothetical protein IT575_00710 [bacterium]|nr:hypothetical protein [bacterium]
MCPLLLPHLLSSPARPLRLLFSFIAAGIITLLLSACGAAAPTQDSADTPGNDSAAGPGLPGLDTLPAPQLRLASAPGQGYMALDPQELIRGYQLDGLSGGGIEFLPAPGYSCFALYGVYGFDGDALPVSVRIGLGAASAGQRIYLAYSDFQNRRWRLSPQQLVSGPGGSTEIMLSYTADSGGADAFISPPGDSASDGCFYFALLMPPQAAGSLELLSLELGSYGGEWGPRPGLDVHDSGNDPATVFWLPSPDYDKPDFAGYMVERAPFWFGDFEPANSIPVRDEFFTDSASSTPQRYRVYCVDNAGNRSPYFPELGSGAMLATSTELFARLSLPRGPLYGGQKVHFDLSASFATGAEAIENYQVFLEGSGAAYSSSDPHINIDLQPGVYRVRARVTNATQVSASVMRKLVVYPVWEKNPTLISELTGPLPRLQDLSGGRLPADGQVYFVGYDPSISSIVAYRRDASGDFSYFDSAPVYSKVDYISDPVSDGDVLLFGLLLDPASANAVMLSPEGMRLITPYDVLPSPAVPVTDAQDRIWMLNVNQTGPAEWSFSLLPVTAFVSSVALFTHGKAIEGMDACFNPALARLEILFQDMDGLHFAAVDPVSGTTLAGPVLISAAEWDTGEIEYDPSSGRCIAIGLVGGHYSCYEWEDSGMSTASELYGAEVNLEGFDFMVSQEGERYCLFAAGAGQVRLFYAPPGSNTWTLSNTVGYL